MATGPRDSTPAPGRLLSGLIGLLHFVVLDRLFGETLARLANGGLGSFFQVSNFIGPPPELTSFGALIASLFWLVALLVIGVLGLIAIPIAFGIVWVLGVAHKLHVLWALGFFVGLGFLPLARAINGFARAVFSVTRNIVSGVIHSTFVELFEPRRSFGERLWALAPLALVVAVSWGAVVTRVPIKNRIEKFFGHPPAAASASAALDPPAAGEHRPPVSLRALEQARAERPARSQEHREQAAEAKESPAAAPPEQQELSPALQLVPGKWYFVNAQPEWAGGYLDFQSVSADGAVAGEIVFPAWQYAHNRFEGRVVGTSVDLIRDCTPPGGIKQRWTGVLDLDARTISGRAVGIVGQDWSGDWSVEKARTTQ